MYLATLGHKLGDKTLITTISQALTANNRRIQSNFTIYSQSKTMYHDAYLLHSAQFMGFVNALRTGDLVLDLMAALILPWVLQKALIEAPAVVSWICRYVLVLFGNSKSAAMCTRRIVYRSDCTTTVNDHGVSYSYQSNASASVGYEFASHSSRQVVCA